jgi:serine O-acetyltransferase
MTAGDGSAWRREEEIDALVRRTPLDPRSREEARELARQYAELRPGLSYALREDGIAHAAYRGDQWQFTSRREEWWNVLRLLWASEDFAGTVLYRFRTWFRAKHIPLLPGLCERLCIMIFHMHIGDDVVIREGSYINHGSCVIQGVTYVGRRTTIAPMAVVLPAPRDLIGPRIGNAVFVGTSAEVVGNIRVGNGVQIGMGAIVVDDAADGRVVAGIPARDIGRSEVSV